ncbi:TetR/AcrR family transcriptional regulator [Streptomyces sp. t39]|uniref:TetR/AcrR family transcriptional regulator n=1 Tax=Streptomyces sp. t39 TaxID=1828156 RepID=UPI0011CE3D60|nr:TetR family transcriptional regulator [Streptomyces sp. t39]TXS57528.1 TetR family transcriptional regulator [Streptomyces sp. t39]
MPTATRSAPVRQRIIEAVLHLIRRDGVAAVTNRLIAEEAGVSLGSVTYHFATQHELLREALLHFARDESRRFTALSEEYTGADTTGGEVLTGRGGDGAAPACGDIATFALYVEAGRDERLRPAAAEAFTAYDRLAARILAGLGVPDPEPHAAAAVALVMGLHLRRLATGSPEEALVDAVLLLARGAAVPAGECGAALGGPAAALPGP